MADAEVAEHKREGGVSLWSLDIEISIIFIQSPLVSQRKIIFIAGDEGEERRRAEGEVAEHKREGGVSLWSASAGLATCPPLLPSSFSSVWEWALS